MDSVVKASIKQTLVCLLVLFVVMIFIDYIKDTAKVKHIYNDTVYCNSNLLASEISTIAKSAIVYDAKDSCVIFQKNENTRTPIASLTKLMTTVIASETLPENTKIQILNTDLQMPDSQGLKEGSIYTLEQLIKLSLLTSSNDGIHAVGRTVREYLPTDQSFISLMNKKAEEIGMIQTTFFNESGLDRNNGENGSISTATDLSKLLIYVYENFPDLLEITTKEQALLGSVDGKPLVYKNTNPFVSQIPSLAISKTGYTELAGGALAIVFERAPLHPIVIVVLDSTKDGRFNDVLTLVKSTIEK